LRLQLVQTIHDMRPPCHLRIGSWEQSKHKVKSCSKHIVFTIKVWEETPHHHHVFGIRKRFRAFYHFHHELCAIGFKPPPLPPSDLWTNLLLRWNTTKESALLARQMKLQQFLDFINASTPVQETLAFKAFVGTRPEEHVGYTSLSGYSTTSLQTDNDSP
jgi:hypothetical protein